MQLDTCSKVDSHNWSTWFHSALPQDTHTSGILKYLHWLPIEQCIKFELATLTHNTLLHSSCLPTLPFQSPYPTRSLCSANANLLSVPCVCTIFATRGISVTGPIVWNSLPFGIRNSSSTHTFHHLLKLTATSRPSDPPSGSPKCLRFGHWLTLCTLNIHLLTHLYWKRVTNLAWLITTTNTD